MGTQEVFGIPGMKVGAILIVKFQRPTPQCGRVVEIKKKADGNISDIVIDLFDPETGVRTSRAWHSAGRSSYFPRVCMIADLEEDQWEEIVQKWKDDSSKILFLLKIMDLVPAS